jgi:tRNA(fMet)-specific endonuclease VapC
VIFYLLDTNICIYLIKKKPVPMMRRLQQKNISEVGISTATLSELEYGVEKSQHPAQNRVALAQFLAPLEVVPYDDRAALEYGRLCRGLGRHGRPIGPLDRLIAAHALALNCTLVTNNAREFSRVENLQVENWIVE